MDGVLGRFPRERTWLLPALREVQHALGWLPEDALAAVASHLRVPGSEVYGVASSYPELRLRPRGRHHVRVCTGVACAVRGGAELLAHAARTLVVTPGEWTADSAVSLEAADCFFECGVAPLIEVDGELHGRATPADVAGIPRRFGTKGARSGTTTGAAEPCSAPVVQSPTATLDRLVSLAESRRRARPTTRLLVRTGTCGRAVGAADLHEALMRERGGAPVDVDEAGCDGACWAAPSVEIQREGWPRIVLERVEARRARTLLDLLGRGTADFTAAGFTGVAWSDAPWRGLTPAARQPFWSGQRRVLLARAGAVASARLTDALLDGAYRALATALTRPPEAVIDVVERAGLQGRGGAFFPAAVKWRAARAAASEPKYLVMNGEEGEPGIFKDRHLMEGDPHGVVEGVLLAAYAAGASRAILYIHGQADLAAERLARAVADARDAGLVGANVLGSGFACEVEVRRGAGGFVLGEETALLESIEGRRAQPRTRPPFPVESGLWGRPTVVNNVETLAAVPSIVAGHPDGGATKVFGISGAVARPGVVEMAVATLTLGRLLRDVGGTGDGGPLIGAVVGGPSGTLVPAALFDVVMEPRGRVSPGTGGVVAVPAGADVVGIVKTLVGFNAAESCGKCTPCREGLPRLLALIDELPRSPDAEAKCRELAEAIQLASLCGLGQAAPLALLRGLESFGAEFTRR
jgi:NADH:ubiquinone oxidoreductase subunit F (NADH-binding)/NADH:ubiquinone oxidoreductase subunit E